MKLGVVPYRLCTHDYDCLTYPSAETTAEAMEAGAIDYLMKSFALDTLERVIEEAGVKEML